MAGILMLWLVVAGVALAVLVGLMIHETVPFPSTAGMLLLLILPIVALPMCLYYGLLRAKRASLTARAVLLLVCMAGVAIAVGWWVKLRADGKRISYVYFARSGQFERRSNLLYKEGRYGELVDAFEQEFDHYESCLKEIGGMEEVIKRAKYPRTALAVGYSGLYSQLHACMDYNAQFTPPDVEYFLMMVYRDTDAFTSELLAFANAMSASSHPMLKSYGLWFLERNESREDYPWDDGVLEWDKRHPQSKRYRDHVYSHALRGEAWAHGFAANASYFDSDLSRVIDFHKRYYDLVHGEPHYRSMNHTLTEQIAGLSKRPRALFEVLGPKQQAFLNEFLDHQLQSTYHYANEDAVRLFEIMGRQADIPVYEQRAAHHYEMMMASHVISGLLRNGRKKEQFSEVEIGRVHRVLDTYLATGTYGVPGEYGNYPRADIRRLFTIMGRGKEFDEKF